MSGSIVTVGNRQYEIIPDLSGRDRVFIIGAVLDDADGREIARQVRVSSDEPLVFMAQSMREIGLSGNPEVAFADQSIAHSVNVTLQAEGYRSQSRMITIPALASLPHRHDFALRRLPLTMKGRVYGRMAGPTPTFVPLSGADIVLSPIPAIGGELPLLLRQPLRADIGIGATIQQKTITAQTGLLAIEDAYAGGVFVEIADGTGVAAGQIIRIGPSHRRFYAEIAQVIAHPDFPAPAVLLQLTEPLVGAIPSNTSIERFVPGAFSGSSGNFVGDAFAGESIIWLDSLPASGGVLVIQIAGQVERYHDANALTGPAGDYLIDGISRIAEPAFEVSSAGFTTNIHSYRLDRLGVEPVDWYLTP